MNVASPNENFSRVNPHHSSIRKAFLNGGEGSFIRGGMAKGGHNHGLVGNVKIGIRRRQAFPRFPDLVVLVRGQPRRFLLCIKLLKKKGQHVDKDDDDNNYNNNNNKSTRDAPWVGVGRVCEPSDVLVPAWLGLVGRVDN